MLFDLVMTLWRFIELAILISELNVFGNPGISKKIVFPILIGVIYFYWVNCV